MTKVFFKSHNKEVECEVGENLLDVARKADIFIDAPCNGSQSCGKCKVKLLEGGFILLSLLKFLWWDQ